MKDDSCAACAPSSIWSTSPRVKKERKRPREVTEAPTVAKTLQK